MRTAEGCPAALAVIVSFQRFALNAIQNSEILLARSRLQHFPKSIFLYSKIALILWLPFRSTILSAAMTIKPYSLVLVASAFALSGCATGPAIEGDKPDTLTVHINNDASGTMVMRSGSLETFSSARCQDSKRVANKAPMSNQEGLATVPVAPGKPLTFAVTTSNAHGFKGNWGCSATVTFTPAAGAIYHATLTTVNDNASCKLVLTDRTRNIAVPVTSPEYSCSRTLAGIVRNGSRYTYNAR